jgi:hypothetical protein
MTPLEQLGKAITDAGYVWTEEMILAYTEAMKAISSPLNGDQVLKRLAQDSIDHLMKQGTVDSVAEALLIACQSCRDTSGKLYGRIRFRDDFDENVYVAKQIAAMLSGERNV